jgi:SpoVK/Ycf46/Vps4 family AAA+-type ATPase
MEAFAENHSRTVAQSSTAHYELASLASVCQESYQGHLRRQRRRDTASGIVKQEGEQELPEDVIAQEQTTGHALQEIRVTVRWTIIQADLA